MNYFRIVTVIVILIVLIPLLHAAAVNFGFGSSSDAEVEKGERVQIPYKIYFGNSGSFSTIRTAPDDIEYIRNPIDGKDQSEVGKALRVGQAVIEAFKKNGIKIEIQ
jgi:hypothetical protein